MDLPSDTELIISIVIIVIIINRPGYLIFLSTYISISVNILLNNIIVSYYSGQYFGDNNYCSGSHREGQNNFKFTKAQAWMDQGRNYSVREERACYNVL